MSGEQCLTNCTNYAEQSERIWRASEVNETLSGVTQLKIGDICYRAK